MRVIKLAGGVIMGVGGRVLWAQSLIRVIKLTGAVISAGARVLRPQGLMRVIKLTGDIISVWAGVPRVAVPLMTLLPLGILLRVGLMAVLIAFTSRRVSRQRSNYFMTPPLGCDKTIVDA